MKISGREYTSGQDRNEDNIVAHLYRGGFNNPGNPMCFRGWNRLDGSGYSIFRNNPGPKGICKVCIKRARAKKQPVNPRFRATKWI